ncbi:[NiFe] hydrogenase maturation protein HypF [Hymenobacter roseosalivarius DSM 11622]|uniref:Carbamoyltransferase n=1 Tax=Hymenobacter roseosalivarius DSM 11622 TaxID=645990 RepID=A0A1W1VMX3_9BACT|nr:carbamoyltransferase HypF [Hymenobacter roseosalivarius]SMB94712.1 [NiFe] hydrogenase maturation protein HypF [Hymenobacter roseosalivarius DSM 11622]
MKKLPTWHIHIQGLVQGVGFRPYVYQLARRAGLCGWVNNTDDGVHVEFNADPAAATRFYEAVVAGAPALARITAHRLAAAAAAGYDDFRILASESGGNPVLLVSPDLAVCAACLEEVHDPRNRRYGYAFTTCTQCGPRYSIIRQLPYDRENTTMAPFVMCPACTAEYHDPLNRRHFSQTNSCPRCPVRMTLFDNREQLIEADQASIITRICALWTAGKIVALKGIGGYLLTCDAANPAAIQELRRRKHRPRKPLALLFPSVARLQREATVGEAELRELRSVAASIVLVALLAPAQSRLALPEIAPRLSTIGVMLPYTPLFELLLQAFNEPIVATSANASSAPIVYQDADAAAWRELSALADYVLTHNREILVPQDDSVVSFSVHARQRIVLRRARGLAPLLDSRPAFAPQTTVLATGALLKSSFTLLHHANTYVSQSLGNTDNYDAQQVYAASLRHLLALFQARPAVVLTDQHPDYFTTHLGQQLAREFGSQLVRIQHHEAHFAAVLGEHDLLAAAEPILGVVWDGTGLGSDGQMWGGEFFVYQHRQFSRGQHFSYFDLFLGDKMAIEPRLAAFSLGHQLDDAAALLRPKFSAAEWRNYGRISGKKSIQTSSVGRLFDAVASLLGLLDKASFEGEAAMLLEEQALSYFKDSSTIPLSWLEQQAPAAFSSQSLMAAVVTRIAAGTEKAAIAAWFHVRLVVAIRQAAAIHQCHTVCCGGGVFQNGLLVDLAVKILGERHRLYFNQSLPPNDENISFGQLQWFARTATAAAP